MNTLGIKKYLTLITVITILIAAPLTAPIAFADNNNNSSRSNGSSDNGRGDNSGRNDGSSDNHDDKKSSNNNPAPTSVIANINGLVTDLGVQKYEINGKGGIVYNIGEEAVTKSKIELNLKATVIDDVVTGSLKLTVKGEIENGKIELTVNIPINSGSPGLGCIDGYGFGDLIDCPASPWSDEIVPFLELENGDFIPIFFAGEGDATLKIGKETTIYPVSVVMDTSTAQHPFKGGPMENTGQVTLADTLNGLFVLSVDVTKFDVEYTAIQLVGEVAGDLEGTMLQIANADEDHVNNVEKDEGDIVFNVAYNEEIIQMTGSYKGYSVQSEDLGYLYISTGTFTTSDGLTIKGEYVTSWTLPLFFTSTFTGIVK